MDKDDDAGNGLLAEITRNWVVLLTMALGGAGVWGSTQTTVGSLREKLDKQDRKIEKLEEQIAQNERIGNEKLMLLGRDIGDVKVSIGRVESTLTVILQQFRLGSPPQASPLSPPGVGRQ